MLSSDANRRSRKVPAQAEMLGAELCPCGTRWGRSHSPGQARPDGGVGDPKLAAGGRQCTHLQDGGVCRGPWVSQVARGPAGVLDGWEVRSGWRWRRSSSRRGQKPESPSLRKRGAGYPQVRSTETPLVLFIFRFETSSKWPRLVSKLRSSCQSLPTAGIYKSVPLCPAKSAHY